MARPHRPAPDHLSYLARAAERIRALGPLALLRGAEARAHGMPRIGASRLPSQDVAELAQAPSLAFPAATLDAVRIVRGRARVEGHWLGLTGPMAPLPLHLSEFASYERRYSKKQPFGGFLDVLAGRMLQLFYRSWATASPAASADRPEEDHFGDRIAALTGAEEGVRADALFPARARLRYAALYASPRSPAAIQDALADLMRMPVRIVEHVPRWRDVEPDERSRVGRGFASLGRDAVTGGRVRTVSDAFRVVVSVSSAEAMTEMLPGGRRYALLAEALDAFAPPHLEWDIELEVANSAIRPARLGGSGRLGWSGWTGPLPSHGTRSDTRLGPSARRLAQTRKKEATA
jgi:type VI secretion system protein ImpH